MGIFGWSADLSKPVRVKAVAASGWGRPREGHVHAGIDIPLPVGTPVYAMGDGVVIRAQATNAGDAAGIWVGIRHADGLVSRYMHLSRTDVALHQRVRRGQQIGLSGNTGIHSSGPHLHADLKAPESLLTAIAAAGGKPSTGWGPMATGYGYGIPGEPWIPVDSYASRTIADAKANGIPLRKASSSAAQVVIFAFLGYGIWRLAR